MHLLLGSHVAMQKTLDLLQMCLNFKCNTACIYIYEFPKKEFCCIDFVWFLKYATSNDDLDGNYDGIK